MTIDIDFDGTVLWNGEAVPDRAALEARCRQAAAQPDQPEVHLRPNKLVEYKSVAEVHGQRRSAWASPSSAWSATSSSSSSRVSSTA